jgi:hypothetical protein
MRRKKTAQLIVRVDSMLKELPRKRRSRTIVRLLSKHLRISGFLSAPKRPHKEAARTALKLALREIGTVGDRSLPAQERESRKGRLIHGPEEFSGFRSDQPKSMRWQR